MIFTLTFLLLIPCLAHASPAEEPQDRDIKVLESTQNILSTRVNYLANSIDMFFAEQRADDELARSRIRLRQGYTFRERSVGVERRQIRINITLPKLQDKFKFEFENKKKKKKSSSERNPSNPQLNERWQFRADTGIIASVPPNIFTRARLRKNKQTGAVIHRFVEELSWFSDRDWEENTTLFSDYSLDESRLMRFNNIALWRITRKEFRTSHGPSILEQLTIDDAISYGVGLSSTIQNGNWFVDNYRLSFNYRRNLYKQWIYSDINPGLDFPKEWGFKRTPFIFLAVEALFGDF